MRDGARAFRHGLEERRGLLLAAVLGLYMIWKIIRTLGEL